MSLSGGLVWGDETPALAILDSVAIPKPNSMPILGLYLKAEVENVESIEAGKDTIWSAFVQCTNCGERSANRVELSPNDEVEVPDSRSTCNCLYKCKGCCSLFSVMDSCKRKIVINVVTDFPSQCTSFEEPGLIAKFEVKGAELVDFQPDVCVDDASFPLGQLPCAHAQRGGVRPRGLAGGFRGL